MEKAMLSPWKCVLTLGAILSLACALRLIGIFADLPFSYYDDELHFIKRAMALGSGDLNPHWFHKPGFLMYLLLFCYGTYFFIGNVFGIFGSVEEFGAYFLSNMGPFILIGRGVVVAFGTATVFVVYRIAYNVFGTFLAGVSAALVTAVLYPMVVGSYSVKADVPAGFFIALSFYWFLKSRERTGIMALLIASLFAGVAMGTKYYGVILIPGYVLVELTRGLTRKLSLGVALLRVMAIGTIFLAGFFIVSPYNFLDSTWLSGVVERIKVKTGVVKAEKHFDPDTQMTFDPSLVSAPVAGGYFLAQAVKPNVLGVSLSILAVVGLAACAFERATRPYAIYVALPLLVFIGFSASWTSFHISWRHFNAILPLVCTLAFPGGLAFARLLRFRGHRSEALAVAVVLILTISSGVRSVRADVTRLEPDSRTAAYHWIIENIPPDARFLFAGLRE